MANIPGLPETGQGLADDIAGGRASERSAFRARFSAIEPVLAESGRCNIDWLQPDA
jgi:hypothetical protein